MTNTENPPAFSRKVKQARELAKPAIDAFRSTLCAQDGETRG